MKTPQPIDGVRVYLGADTDANKVCPPKMSASETAIIDVSPSPTPKPFDITTTTVAITTRDSITTRPPGLTRPGQPCQVCGDQASQRPCDDMELVIGDLTMCPMSQPYCMNDIIQHGTNVAQYKRCVDEATCYSLWYQATSDEPLCLKFDPSSPIDQLTCHLCCYGEGCNLDPNPREDLLYRPGRRQLEVRTRASFLSLHDSVLSKHNPNCFCCCSPSRSFML
jgi:hypothetical protein